MRVFVADAVAATAGRCRRIRVDANASFSTMANGSSSHPIARSGTSFRVHGAAGARETQRRSGSTIKRRCRPRSGWLFVSTRTGNAEVAAMLSMKNLDWENGGVFGPCGSRGTWIAFHPIVRRQSCRPGSFESIQSTEIYVMRADAMAPASAYSTGAFLGQSQLFTRRQAASVL